MSAERRFECKKKNGVYLFKIIKQQNGYLAKTTIDEALFENVKIHDGYIGTADGGEFECEWYAAVDETLHLGLGESGSVLNHQRCK